MTQERETDHGSNRGTEEDRRSATDRAVNDAAAAEYRAAFDALRAAAARASAGPVGVYGYPAPFARPRGDPPEPVYDTMPRLAHRAAHLRYEEDGSIVFGSIGYTQCHWGVMTDAICMRQKAQYLPMPHTHHEGRISPDWDCECGFYGVPADVPAQHDNRTVDLLVELSGRIIEHETGYRAQRQSVLECRLRHCATCGRTPCGVLLRHSQVYPVCTLCAIEPVDGDVIHRDTLARMLGVPVTVMP